MRARQITSCRWRWVAVAILAALAWLLFPGCAADGSFDAQAFDTVARAGFDTYDRYQHARYPDRPIYPPGAPFPIYPAQQ